LLVGRDLQERHGQKAQVIITTPLLEGTDGVEKMSKSYGNHIALTDSAENMYGKTMSIPDNLIEKYFILAADASIEVVSDVKEKLNDISQNPRDIKRDLARRIVALYYSEEAAEKAEQHFDKVVVRKVAPDNIDEYKLKKEEKVVEIIFNAELVTSKGEARRMINQNAVKIDGIPIADIQDSLKPEKSVVIKVGKRRFLRIIV
jgi:tyrosyl-tRNA synthetase